ncbi:hypothetical protein [Nostoc sp. ChiVER01]|nr:hypothetical protein [Nostoc sp. ChiVER01]MDZ8221915.1 hypothetical protein [Nostoc sp. ChiVER01]
MSATGYDARTSLTLRYRRRVSWSMSVVYRLQASLYYQKPS